MKKSSTVTVLVMGIAVLIAVVLLFYVVAPGIGEAGATVRITILVIVGGVVLFILGGVVGQLYGKSVRSQKIVKEIRTRFREALHFEREERLRLERRLQEAKQNMNRLEERLPADAGVAQKPIVSIAGEENGKLKGEFAELSAKHDQLHDDLSKRKERIADLMAELSVAQSEAEEARSEAENLRASVGVSNFSMRFSFDGKSIKEILHDIVALEGVRMALIADDYGLVVEAVGEGLPSDTVAAISNLVERLGPQVREILPMGEVSTVSLGDEDGLVLDTRYFDLFGVRCALAIARYEDFTYPGLAKKAIELVVNSMEE